MNLIRAAIALTAVTLATPAAAQCVWKYDCTSGQCVQVPICRNTYDIPPVRPLELPPIPPIQSVRPIQLPPIPPIGTRQCVQRYICTNGQCAWRQVCQ